MKEKVKHKNNDKDWMRMRTRKCARERTRTRTRVITGNVGEYQAGTKDKYSPRCKILFDLMPYTSV